MHAYIISHDLNKIKEKRWAVSIGHYKIQDCMVAPHCFYASSSYENMFLHNT